MTQIFKCENKIMSNREKCFSDNPIVAVLSQLNKNPYKVFTDIQLQKQIYSDQDFKEIFNFSLYFYLTSPEIKYARIKEIYENLKKFIFLNSNDNSNTLPIFYFSTIQKSFVLIGTLLENELFFISKENLNTLEELIPFMQDICTKMNQLSLIMTKTQFESADNCVKHLYSIYIKLKDLNNKYNNYNKEKVNFALAHYRHIELCGEVNNKNITSSIKTTSIISSISSNTYDLSNNENSSNNKTSSVTYETELKYFGSYLNDNKIEINNKNISNIKNFSVIKENIAKSIQVENNKIISDDMIILKAKTKNYNNNHFSKDTFVNKYLKSFNIKYSIIDNTLTSVALNYFNYVKKEKIDPLVDYIDFTNLKAIFSNYFPGHLIYLIGSVRSFLLYDTKDSPAKIDFLLLPNIYSSAESSSKNIRNHIGVFKNLNGIMGILKSINANKALTHEFKNLDKVEDIQLENFYLNFDLVNKMNKNRHSINANLIFYDEKLKMSSDITTYVFYNNTKLQALHIFFQEILMNALKLIKTRRDLSVIILSYLNTTYDSKNSVKQRYFYNLSFKGLKDGTLSSSKKVAKNFKNSELVEESYFYWYREFSEESLNLINKIELGELIMEFLRYAINYFNYLKNQYNVKINKNFQICKGYEYLKDQFHDFIYNPNESYNLINHLFLVDILSLTKKEYDLIFCRKLNALEEIYFKICENSEKITNMNQIIANVNINITETE